MPTVLVPGEDDQTAIMACIGNICVQWALLETNILHIVGLIEQMPPDEAYIVFGGLDIRPRLNMAINLSQHHGYPTALTNQLTALRTDMKNSDIANRRNTAIHGVHSESDAPHSMKLTMVRYPKDRRNRDMSVLDFHALGNEIQNLAVRAYSIFESYGNARLPKKRHQHFDRAFPHGNPGIWVKIKQHFLRR